MSAKSAISGIGTYAIGLVIMLAVLSIPALLIHGVALIGPKVFPWLMSLSIILLALNIVVLLPMSLIPPTRPWAGLGFFISSYIFGLTGWFMGLLLTWAIWGGVVVIIGLLFMGIGVVPLGMLATLFNGMWLELGLLTFVLILTFGLRTLGMTLAEKA